MPTPTTSKDKPLSLTTPIGSALYPHLRTPDMGPPSAPKDVGEYTIKLVFPATSEEWQEFVSKCEQVRDAFFDDKRTELLSSPKTKPAAAKLKKDPVAKEQFDKETGDGTGKLVVAFKSKSEIKDRKDPSKRVPKAPPPVFDCTGKEIPKTVDIWSGSECRVACAVMPYYVAGTGGVGVTLYMNAVQVKKLVSSGSSPVNNPFGNIEDGEPVTTPAEDAGFPSTEGDDTPTAAAGGDY